MIFRVNPIPPSSDGSWNPMLRMLAHSIWGAEQRSPCFLSPEYLMFPPTQPLWDPSLGYGVSSVSAWMNITQWPFGLFTLRSEFPHNLCPLSSCGIPGWLQWLLAPLWMSYDPPQWASCERCWLVLSSCLNEKLYLGVRASWSPPKKSRSPVR